MDKLKSISLNNFQNHKNTKIDLSDRITIISGESNNGKTAILRSVNLVLNNRPTGYNYKPWNATKKDITECNLFFTDGAVTRRKSDTINEYLIKADNFTQEPMVAFGQNVPEEVSRFCNLDECNFQQQLDGYFFIGLTPGERAKKINDVCGLSLIDTSLSNANNTLSTTKTKIDYVSKEVKRIETKLEEYGNLETTEKLVNQYEELVKEYNFNKTRIESIKLISRSLQEIEEKKSKLINFLKHTASLNGLKLLLDHGGQIQARRHQIADLNDILTETILGIAKHKKRLKSQSTAQELNKLLSLFLSAQDRKEKIKGLISSIDKTKEKCYKLQKQQGLSVVINQIKTDVASYNNLTFKRNEIQSVLSSLVESSKAIYTGETKKEQFVQKKNEFYDNLKICPFCKRGM